MVFLDGTVLPSIYGSADDAPKQIFSTYSLRQGEVIGVVYPEEKFKSKTKQIVEYTVLVQQQDKNGAGTHVIYPNCIPMNPLGGGADWTRHTYRVRTAEPPRGKTNGDGSKVLVLCVNGDTRNAYIVGGVSDTLKDQPKDSKDSGHNLFFEFNGLQFTVDKEGQAKVMFRGATKVDGTLSDDANADAEGTNVFFDKDGGVKISTPDDAQHIFVDHANKTIEILADENWKVTVNGKTDIEVQDNITINSSAGEIDVGAANNVKIKSAGVLVGDATDAWIKGTTYRAAESAMMGQLAVSLGALTQALTAITAAMAGAVATAPSFGSPAILATMPTAIAAMNQAASAIQQFEGQAAQFLSLKNKTD